MRAASILLAAAAVLFRATPATADEKSPPTAEEIAAATGRATAWLVKKQQTDGSWGPVGGNSLYGGGTGGKHYEFPLGSTAWCLFALLASGVPKDDPAIKKGFAWLDKNAKAGVGQIGPSAYEVSAMLLATTARTKGPVGWRRAESAPLEGPDRARALKYVNWLLEMRTEGKASGWRYDTTGPVPPGGNEDLSSTGIAATALFSADRCGVRVATDVWSSLAKFAMRQQDPDGPERERGVDENPELGPPGRPPTAPPAPTDSKHKDRARGFAYIRSSALEADEGKSTGGMTGCGIATIQIARLVLGSRVGKEWRAEDQELARRAVLDGCAWLDANWSASANPGKKSVNLYHVLYALHVADAMDLVGTARLGDRAWYDQMARSLLEQQKESGCWDTSSSHRPADVLDTSFALLFFARPFSAPRADAPAPK